MNVISQKFWSVAATAIALSTATIVTSESAHALSFSLSPVGTFTQTTWVGQPTTVIDFSSVTNGSVPGSATSIATSPTNGNATIEKSNAGGAAAIYTNNPAPLFTGGDRYLAVGSSNDGSPVTNPDGSVLFKFDAPKGLGYFGLFWASPSLNDRITFTLRNAAGVLSNQVVNASDVFGSSTEGRYVNFFATNIDPRVITQVLLEDLGTSNDRSFEVDNIAYQAIPTPALLPGLLTVGLGLLRKRKMQPAEAEA